MSIYSALSHYAAEWRAARNEARTYRVIGSLPREVQKDIGWPDAFEHPTRSHAAGNWAGGHGL